MGKIYDCMFCILVALFLQLESVESGCDAVADPAVYIYPLGEGILSYEINNQSWAGSYHNIAFNDGPPELNYSAIQFNAADESYIEFPVYNHDLLVEDYAIMLHLYVESDGVFMHYKSDDYGSNGTHVESIKCEILGGTWIVTIYSSLYGETHGNFTFDFSYNTWHKLVFIRNRSVKDIEVEIYTGIMNEYDSQKVGVAEWYDGMWTSLPGTLRIGGSQDGGSFFGGRATCVNIIPACRQLTVNSFTATCTQANWPTLTTPPSTTSTSPTTTTTTPTTTTTTPTTTTATPTTTTTTPTTTTATPTTTTATPTTTTATPTTTTTTLTTTTTTSTTTTTTPTTTTTTPTTTTTTPTTTTTTPPITTTTPTTTTPSQTTTTPTATATTPTIASPGTSPATLSTPGTMTPTTTASVTPSPATPRSFHKFKLVAANTAFAAGEALDDVTIVPNPLACSRKCSAHVACWSFVFQAGGGCWLGPRFPVKTGGVGALLYELV